MELPLYSKPTVPLSMEEQIKVSNVFNSLDNFRDSFPRHASTILNNSCSKEDDVVLESRSMSTQGIKTDSPFSQNTFLGPDSDLPPEPTTVEKFVPPSPEVGVKVRSRAELLDVPVMIDVDSIRSEEFSYSADRLGVGSGDSPRSQMFLLITHSKIFPDSIHPPENDLEERKAGEFKAKPSIKKNLVLSRDTPKSLADGLRFLIVVSGTIFVIMQYMPNDIYLSRPIITIVT